MKAIPFGGLTRGIMMLLGILAIALILSALRLAETGIASLRGPADAHPVAAVDFDPQRLRIALCGYSLDADMQDLQKLAAKFTNTIRHDIASFARWCERAIDWCEKTFLGLLRGPAIGGETGCTLPLTLSLARRQGCLLRTSRRDSLRDVRAMQWPI